MSGVREEEVSNGKTLSACDDGSITGMKLQICEEQLANTAENRLPSMNQKCQLNDDEGRHWQSGEVNEISVTGMTLQICEDEGAVNTRGKKQFLMNGKCLSTEEDVREWRCNGGQGNVTRLMFGYETKWPTKRQKQFPKEEAEGAQNRQEITVSLDMGSNKKIAKKESRNPASDSGHHFEDVFEGDLVETPRKNTQEGKVTSLQIYDDVGSTTKSEAQRRSRKGTPCRRHPDNFTRLKGLSDELSETDGLLRRGASPENEGYDNWLNTRHEHRKTNVCSGTEQGSQEKQRGAQTTHGTFQDESDSEGVPDEESEDATIPLPTNAFGCQNGNCIHFAKGRIKSKNKSNAMKSGCTVLHSPAYVEGTSERKTTTSQHKHHLNDSELGELTSNHQGTPRKHRNRSREFSSHDDDENGSTHQKHSSLGYHVSANRTVEKECPSTTNSWANGDTVTSSSLSISDIPSLAVHSTIRDRILKEHNMAVRLGRGIPLYLAGRHKWINRDESLWFHKHPSLLANENEERQFIPAIQHGHTLATGGRFVDPSYPWGYVGNMIPLMYPVMGSDRNRDDLCALNTIPSSEGDLQLKRSLEDNGLQAVHFKKATPSDCHALNDQYDRGDHRKYHTPKDPEISMQERTPAAEKEFEKRSHLEENCQTKAAEEINGHGTDHQQGDQNGYHETDLSAEGDDSDEKNEKIVQAQSSGLAASEGNEIPKARHSRRSKGESQSLSNPWGKSSYSDLITMALLSSPGKKMTLDEIYRWITTNVPYFRDKGEELSSSGWKNSVRHTLSVRQRFVRLPRMLNGNVSHKSWWTLSNNFLRKRSPIEPNLLKPSLQAAKAANEKQASQGTQTEELVCGWCACTVLRK